MSYLSQPTLLSCSHSCLQLSARTWPDLLQYEHTTFESFQFFLSHLLLSKFVKRIFSFVPSLMCFKPWWKFHSFNIQDDEYCQVWSFLMSSAGMPAQQGDFDCSPMDFLLTIININHRLGTHRSPAQQSITFISWGTCALAGWCTSVAPESIAQSTC